MRIAHVSMTPIAGACWAWSEAFKEAGYDSFSVASKNYGDGRIMPADYGWPATAVAIAEIRAADLIFCYQGHPYQRAWYPRHKPTVFVYVSQNESRYIWRGGEADGWPWAVDGEYQTRLYPDSIPVPECLPLNHPWFQPAEKPADRVRIVYSPSNTNRDGWDDKGYEATCRILNELAADTKVEVDVIVHRPFDECLERKRTAHISIDECVTGAFHGCSMQALVHGSIPVNNADAGCMVNLRRMSGADAPFVRCDMNGLLLTLRSLVRLGPRKLTVMGAANRAWMEAHWNPRELIERNFLPLIKQAMDNA